MFHYSEESTKYSSVGNFLGFFFHGKIYDELLYFTGDQKEENIY